MEVSPTPFAVRDGLTFDGQGCPNPFIAIKGVETIMKFTIPFECEFSGVQIINCAVGDRVLLQVCLPDDTVINQFGTGWWMTKDELNKQIQYASRLPAGVEVRVVYTNSDTVNDRTIYVNYDLHRVLVPVV